MSDRNKTHIELLTEGQIIKFRPHGNSMVPIISSGQLVTIAPVSEEYPNGSFVYMPMPKLATLCCVR